MMTVVAGCVCVGIGCLLSRSSQRNQLDAILLERATHIPELKGLEECLEKTWRNPLAVVVHGTVGSTSTVENSRSSVFVEETAVLEFKRMIQFGEPIPDQKRTLVSRKEDDGTARVYITDYRFADGFYDVLKSYFSTEIVVQYFESLVNNKTIKIPDVEGSKCRQVLEIGTDLTVYGRAVRDEDGAPKIQRVFNVYSGRVELNKMISDLKSKSESSGNLSMFFTFAGWVLMSVFWLREAKE
ncbi:unnamed protein product [Microthlaspi erraticum]|uniref:RING-type E3 ubiquitin transferase n=1 Tax=Microthlaspi erraticum TaxID=1685480 RepID=A0A6D2ITP1_9BRAS|nr:unnamed protein product [Microthlaspi erraticum]